MNADQGRSVGLLKVIANTSCSDDLNIWRQSGGSGCYEVDVVIQGCVSYGTREVQVGDCRGVAGEL